MDLAQLEGRIHEWGALYHAYLATGLRQHGVEMALDRRTEMSRLTAVPESVVAQFSKRTLGGTESARLYAESLGLDWESLSPERKIGLLKSGVQDPRAAKSDDVSDITAWRKDAQAIGYNHRSVLRPDAIQPELKRDDRLEMAYRAALPLLEKQFERRSVIDGAVARVTAAKSLIIAGIESAEDVNTLTRAFRERGITRRGEDASLIWGTVVGAQGREKTAITTTLELREENALIETARAGGRDKSAALAPAKIEAAIRAFPKLDFTTEHGQAQRAIIDKIGTGSRVALAIGVAGSGKSTLLKPLVRAWQEEGRAVHGIALAWRQSDDLAEAGIAKEASTRAVAAFLKAAERGAVILNKKTVLVVDEVGLLGTRQLNDILSLQKKTKFQLVMIGDQKQMQAVEAGPVIDLLRRALGPENVPELGSSVRQETEEERETTLMFRNGQTGEALDRKAANDTLHVAPGGYREAITHVAELWQQRYEANRDRPDYTITVSAPTNAEAHDVSVAIRERRRAMAEIGVDKITVQAGDGRERNYHLPLAEGDRVRLFKRVNAKFTDTDTVGNIGRNGSVLEVVEIRKDGLLLKNEAGRAGFVAWTTLKDEKTDTVLLAYGNALTTNTAQGTTVTEHIHAMPAGTRAVTGFAAYTSGSRHREQSFIVTSEGAERSEIAGRRPLGDRRRVSHADVLDNMKRNLARQPEKDSASAMMERATSIRRGTTKTVQAAHQKIEARIATQQTPTNLPSRFANRRLTRALESRLPGLSAQLRRYGEAIATIAQSGTALAERIAQMARRHSKRQTAEQYWESVAAKASPQAQPDASQGLHKDKGLGL